MELKGWPKGTSNSCYLQPLPICKPSNTEIVKTAMEYQHKYFNFIAISSNRRGKTIRRCGPSFNEINRSVEQKLFTFPYFVR